jgi:hypothetical protein
LAAVRLAVANELRRLDDETPLRERIAAIRRSIVARWRDKADKRPHRRGLMAIPVRKRRRLEARGTISRHGRIFARLRAGGSFTTHAT